MDTRERIIEHITYSAAEDMLSAMAYGDWPTRAAILDEPNAHGWTVDLSSRDPSESRRGTIVRHEGVRLTADELDRVWSRAGRLLDAALAAR